MQMLHIHLMAFIPTHVLLIDEHAWVYTRQMCIALEHSPFPPTTDLLTIHAFWSSNLHKQRDWPLHETVSALDDVTFFKFFHCIAFSLLGFLAFVQCIHLIMLQSREVVDQTFGSCIWPCIAVWTLESESLYMFACAVFGWASDHMSSIMPFLRSLFCM